MLTQNEKNYLVKINPNKRVSVKRFDPKAKEIGELIISKLKEKFSTLKILFMGATALGIVGQNDIDIYVLANPKDFAIYSPILKELFGKPGHIHKTFIEWSFTKNDYPVELYLTKPPKKQIKVFEILKSNTKLLKEYESLKLKFDGKSFRDYQKAKYEFYHKILRQ